MADASVTNAESVLKALGLLDVPVDPFQITREEGIELAPGEYGPGFDARIEYLAPVRTFVVYYREAGPGRTTGRVRFSLAHELGHYYIPHHREELLAGKCHNSVSDFLSRDLKEREADEFAASLLMPEDLFVSKVREHRQGVCTLAELARLANDVFQTSLTSTVLRYCTCDVEACALIVSELGKIKWARHSYDMQKLGMGYIQFGDPVPAGTKTAELWRQTAGDDAPEIVEGRVDAGRWYDQPYRDWVWEEAIVLGRTGHVLTYLTLDDPASV